MSLFSNGMKFACAILLCFTSHVANARSFGTKFVCCNVESTSELGGGGCTKYTPTLRDRALTQVDAQVRCGFNEMHWATHQCPTTQCSHGNSGPTNTTYTWQPAFAGGWYECSDGVSSVENHFCGKPARIVERFPGADSCRVTINGRFDRSLRPGELDCPAGVPVPSASPNYEWENGLKYCFTKTPTFSRVANAFCGQPSRVLDIQATYCTVYVEGEYNKLIMRGVEDCPAG